MCCRSGQDRLAHRSNSLVEAVELQSKVPIVDGISGGEVREHARALKPTVEVDSAAQLQHVLATHANARHAGVYG